MPIKTYVSHRNPGLTLSWPGQKVDLYFVGGKLSTDDSSKQAFCRSAMAKAPLARRSLSRHRLQVARSRLGLSTPT